MEWNYLIFVEVFPCSTAPVCMLPLPLLLHRRDVWDEPLDDKPAQHVTAATATVRAPPRCQVVHSCTCRPPTLPPHGAHPPPRGRLCPAFGPGSTRTTIYGQCHIASRPLQAATTLTAPASAAAWPRVHTPQQPRLSCPSHRKM
jgi:hypothetical protein